MRDKNIEPHRITKPIQLLAAWLAGLAIINSSFLFAASFIQAPAWIPGMLAIAAVANVPIFILSLFLLQTKFRPEMQEDSFYSQHLERKYSAMKMDSPPIDLEKNVREIAHRILSKIPKQEPGQEERVFEILKASGIDQLKKRFENSRTLSEIFVFADKWAQLLEQWGENPMFLAEVEDLQAAGLVHFKDNSLREPELTEIGREVASQLEKEKKLWHQTNERTMRVTKGV